jgi:hypothetical protein
VVCEDLPTCRFGVVDDNTPNMLVASCNASSVGGEECGEAWAWGSPHAPLRGRVSKPVVGSGLHRSA